jgi:hypothetical protein
MFLHTFYTWSLSNLLFGFVMLIDPLASAWMRITAADIIGIIFFSWMFSSVMSFPCLLIGWLLLGLIIQSDKNVLAKFILWISAVLSLIALAVLGVMLMVGFDTELGYFGLCAAFASIIAIGMRVNHFLKLNLIETS